MRQIIPANKVFSALCGEQKKRADLSYRFSNHCIREECEEGILLYQTLTGELLLLEKEEEIISQKEELISKWFYVPEGQDENHFADEIRKVSRMMRPHRGIKTTFTVLSTTDCNARCYYCYEKGIARVAMTDETAHTVADYIARASR